MNEPGRCLLPDDQWIAELADTVRRQRTEVHGFLTAYRQRQQSAQTQFTALVRQWQELRAGASSPDSRLADDPIITDLQAERDGLASQLRRSEAQLRSTADLQAERDDLASQLRRSEAQLRSTAERLAERESTAAQPDEGADDVEGYRRRYEFAVDEIRELKDRCEQLQEQLQEQSSRRPAPAQPVHAAALGTLDWEAEKRRILAAWAAESDGPTSSPDSSTEVVDRRAEVEEIVRRTDEIIAARDQEIAELKQLLENQSANLGSMAVGAAALGAIFDQDAIIQEERETLRQLQCEWEGKLRTAEVEISIERAKLARQRAELDERSHTTESRSRTGDDEAPPQGKRPRQQGRWFSRLGLKDSSGE